MREWGNQGPQVLGLGNRTREQQLRFGNQQLSVQDWVRPSGQRCPGVAGPCLSRGKASWTGVLKQAWRSSGRPPASQLWLSVYTK